LVVVALHHCIATAKSPIRWRLPPVEQESDEATGYISVKD